MPRDTADTAERQAAALERQAAAARERLRTQQAITEERALRRQDEAAERTVRAQERAAAMAVQAPPRDPSLPCIALGTDERRVADEALAAVAPPQWGLYQRSGALVQVVRDLAPRPPGEPPAPPRIVLLPHAVLRERLAACANWQAHVPVASMPSVTCHTQVHPPRYVVDALHSRGEWAHVRRLRAVTETPTLRPDGTILQSPGYDAATGLLYEPTAQYEPVPDAPDWDAARDALAQLHEVLKDFRFAGPEHLSAAVCAILSPFAHTAHDGPAPLHLISANVRGSGKSLLADVIHLINFGRRADPEAADLSGEELEKRLLAHALAGTPSICLDNATGALGSPGFDRQLTATTIRGRVLGRSEMLAMPLRPVWYATANNISLGADIARRTLEVKIEVLDEHPEQRSGFAHPDLRAWVRAERPRLVRACLTVLRAYAVAGRPDQGLTPMASFEAWQAWVANAVVFAGGDNPMAAVPQETASAGNDVQACAAILAGLRAGGCPPRGWTAAQIIEIVRCGPTAPQLQTEGAADEVRELLRAALDQWAATRAGDWSARSLGRRLSDFRRRVIRGCYLDVGSSAAGVIRWTVRTTDQSPGDASPHQAADLPRAPDAPAQRALPYADD